MKILLSAHIYVKFLPAYQYLFQVWSSSWNFLKYYGLWCLLELDKGTEGFQNFYSSCSKQQVNFKCLNIHI